MSFHPAQHDGPSWILINFCNATQLNNLTCQHNFTQLIFWFLKSELTSRNVHPCHLESVEVRRHLQPPAVSHQSMLKLENWIDSVHKWLQLNCNHHICDLTHVVECLRSYKEGNWVGLIVQNLQHIDHQSWLFFFSCIATTTSFKKYLKLSNLFRKSLCPDVVALLEHDKGNGGEDGDEPLVVVRALLIPAQHVCLNDDFFSIEMMLMLCHSHLMLSNGMVGRRKSKWATKCNNFGNFNNFTSTLTVAKDNQDEIPQKHKHSRNWLCDCANVKIVHQGWLLDMFTFVYVLVNPLKLVKPDRWTSRPSQNLPCQWSSSPAHRCQFRLK